MQSIQFNIYGIEYSAFYGPYIGLGFSDLFNLKFEGEMSIAWIKSSIGFDNTTTVEILLNFIAIILYLIFIKNAKRKKMEDSLRAFD
jgi:hypothetical protein